MLTPVRTNAFKREFKNMLKRGKDETKFHKVALMLMNEMPLGPEHHDHKLSGDYVGRRECHVEPDWLLIYEVTGNEIIFERTGTHSDLFKK